MSYQKLGGHQPYVVAPQGAAPPTPPDYANAYLVLATDIVATGTDITAWNDESPAADIYSPQGGGAAPQLSSINGVPAPLMGADDYFDGTDPTDDVFRSTGFELFGVAQPTGAGGSITPYYSCAALLTGIDGWIVNGIAADGVTMGYNGGTLGDVQVDDPVNILDNTPHVIRAWYDAATSTLGLQVDDRAAVTLVTGEPPRASDVPALRVGRSWDGLFQLLGRASVWVYPYLSVADRAQMYAFLAATYGVTVP